MFNFLLAANLTAHTFSLKKGSLRFPTPKRIFSAFFILPGFFVLIVVNKIFMLLDWIFFPGFRKMELKKTSFIVGVPRSATTYLFNILARDKEHFTCFKLWEILFAPSIIQKFILAAILKIDRWVGRPLYRVSLSFDKIFLGKIAALHETSLSKPEEDEMLLIYAFASMYLAYFFPEVRALDPYLLFDDGVSTKQRMRLMLFYKRCVQRHAYVFDRKGQKFFLSKNPAFVCKTASIAEVFPDARLIYMLRSPLKTIPSTISLNLNVYSVFSGKRDENPLSDKTTDIIINWYKMADDSIKKHWQNKSVTVPFKRITNQPKIAVQEIYRFLNIVPAKWVNEFLKIEQAKSGNYKSSHKYSNKIDERQEDISMRLNFVCDGLYSNEI